MAAHRECPGGLASAVPSDEDALPQRIKSSGVRHDDYRPAGPKHYVLRPKLRRPIRWGMGLTLTRNRQIDRFCQLDQRRRVAVSSQFPLALETVKPQLALEMLLHRFGRLGLAQDAGNHPFLGPARHPGRRTKSKTGGCVVRSGHNISTHEMRLTGARQIERQLQTSVAGV